MTESENLSWTPWLLWQMQNIINKSLRVLNPLTMTASRFPAVDPEQTSVTQRSERCGSAPSNQSAAGMTD